MLMEELGTDHVRTACAKGLSRRLVLRRHAAPMTCETAQRSATSSGVKENDLLVR